jgi:hypothetical protein
MHGVAGQLYFTSFNPDRCCKTCKGHTDQRVDVLVLAECGNGVPALVPDEGETGRVVRRIWRHSAVEQGKLLTVAQRWRRRTERHLERTRGLRKSSEYTMFSDYFRKTSVLDKLRMAMRQLSHDVTLLLCVNSDTTPSEYVRI